MNNVRCKKSIQCGIGKNKRVRNGRCQCLKIKNFEPGTICGSNKRWNKRQWRCVNRKCTTTRKCSYGKKWNKNKCVCKRSSWCPVEKECGHKGKFWDKVKCRCLTHEWCPVRKSCRSEGLGARWNNKKCECEGGETDEERREIRERIERREIRETRLKEEREERREREE